MIFRWFIQFYNFTVNCNVTKMSMDQLSLDEYDEDIVRNFDDKQYLFAPLVDAQAFVTFQSDPQRSVDYLIDLPYRRQFNYEF